MMPTLGSFAVLLSSSALSRLVLYAVLFPTETPRLRCLQRHLGLGPRSLLCALDRLTTLSVVEPFEDGRCQRIRIRGASRRWASLRRLARGSASPGEVLQVALADLSGVGAVFLPMSLGGGDPPRKFGGAQAFVVGRWSRREQLAERCERAAALLGVPVEAAHRSQAEIAERLLRGEEWLVRLWAGGRRWSLGNLPVTFRQASG
jgi:hypothetical protein